MQDFRAAPNTPPEQAATLQPVRAEALNQIIRGVIAVAFVAVAGFSLTAFSYGTWSLVGLYAFLLAGLVGLAALPRLPFRLRGGLFLSLLYLVGLFAAYNADLGGAARLFFVGFAVLATTIYGLRAGLAAGALSVLTWLGLAVAFGLFGLQPAAPNKDAIFLDWISAGASMVLVMIALIIPQRQFIGARLRALTSTKEVAELNETRARLAEQARKLEQVSREALQANQRLEKQSGQLERRAAVLALSAEVAQAAAAQHELGELLDTTVNLIATRFNYYHAGVFLLDDAGEWAVLRAANSQGGQALLARGHRLRVGQEGIVGYVTHTGQPRLALDVGADAVHFANPDLPETHSEVAVPIHARGVLIGALDVQSVEVNAFTAEDVRALETLANQVGVAIDNARLIQETNRRLAELMALQQISRDPDHLGGTKGPLAYRYDGLDVQPLNEVTHTPAGDDVLSLPLRFGDQNLGLLELRRAGEAWSDEDLALSQAVAERMALALESAQLFEATRARAQQLAALSQASLEFTGPQFSTTQVLAGVARAAQRLFGAGGANVWLPAGPAEIELSATAGTDPASGRRLRRDQGVAGRVFASGRPLHVDAALEWAEAPADFHATLAVPLLWQSETLGVLELIQTHPGRRFTSDDENVAQLFAAQAASTLENARLFAETQQRLGELATINALSQALAAQLDRQALAETVGRKVGQAFGHDAFVALYDSQANQVEIPYFTSAAGERIALPPFPLGEDLTSHVIQTRRPLLVNANTAERVAQLGARQQNQVAQSWLGVPILLGEDVLGVLSVQDLETEGLFTENDVRLLTTIAANVGVALQNVRLFEQTEQRAAELAVVNDLARAISEQLEPTQVLQTVYEQVQRIAPLDGFFVTLYDHATGLQSTPLIYEGGRRSEEGPRLLPSRGLIRHVIDTGEEVVINRTPEEVEQIALSPEQAMGHASQVAASMLYLPLHFGQQVGGVMSVQSYAPNTYSQRQVDVLTAVANHVVVALQNARLFEETERRAEQLATASEVARATISVLDPDDLIVQAVELIRDRFERSAGVYYAALFLVEETGRWARLRHATGNAGRVLLERQHKLEVGGNSMVGWSTANKRARLALDVGAEPVRFANPLLPHTRSELALPLIVGETVLGALDVQSTMSGAFSEADVAVLQTMADQIGIALRNAQLLTSTQRTQNLLAGAAEVARVATASLDRAVLLTTTVELIRSRFGFYHVSLFEVEPGSQVAILRESTGEAGRALKAHGHQLAVGSRSLVGTATARRQNVIVQDVTSAPAYFPNPLLPETRAEAVLPLLIGENVVGALDVQSTQTNAFGAEDIAVLKTVADQIAVALQNARLFERTARQAHRERQVVDITSKIRANSDIDSMLRTAVDELRQALGTTHAAVRFSPLAGVAGVSATPPQGAEQQPGEGPAGGRLDNGHDRHIAPTTVTDETQIRPVYGASGTNGANGKGANGAQSPEG